MNSFDFNRDFIPALIPDPRDDRDILLGSYIKPRRIPTIVEWYFSDIEVKNQGKTSTCVGQSCSYLKEIQEYFEHNTHYVFDGFDLYRRCKTIDGYSGEGTFLRVALKIVSKEGLVPSNISPLESFKIASYARLEGLIDMKYAIASTGPIVVGIKVYGNISNINNDTVPDPVGTPEGGHAVILTGYDDTKQAFRLLNSWGKGWGNNGWAWISYNYIENYLVDAWSVIDVDDPVVESFIDTSKMLKDVEKVKNGSN